MGIVAKNAVKAKKKALVRQNRPTRAQVRENLALFAPSPSFHADATRVKILQDRGNLLAFLDVDLYLGHSRIFMMRGVRIVRQNDGSIYCQLPHQQSQRDKRYYPIICAYDRGFKEAIQSAAVTAYEEAVTDPVVQLAINLDLNQAAYAQEDNYGY